MRLIISIIVCELAGAIGSIFTMRSVGSWYVSLKKPVFTPPSWIFGPVWTTLYCMMGISAYLIWREGLTSRPVRVALMIFAVQLVLNSLWSAAFFGMRSPAAGLAAIILLLIAICATIYCFARVSVAAAVLLVPYLAWVFFATILNASFLILN